MTSLLQLQATELKILYKKFIEKQTSELVNEIASSVQLSSHARRTHKHTYDGLGELKNLPNSF